MTILKEMYFYIEKKIQYYMMFSIWLYVEITFYNKKKLQTISDKTRNHVSKNMRIYSTIRCTCVFRNCVRTSCIYLQRIKVIVWSGNHCHCHNKKYSYFDQEKNFVLMESIYIKLNEFLKPSITIEKKQNYDL